MLLQWLINSIAKTNIMDLVFGVNKLEIQKGLKIFYKRSLEK